MTPDQPTGMNELREALKTLQAKTVAATPESWYLPMINEAEAAIQEIVERCLIEIEDHHPTCRDDYCDCGALSHNLCVSKTRHNLQQAGLLRGDDI